MKITGIQKQKKIKDRYNVFIDGEYAFALYKDTVVDFGLRVNDEVSDKQINELKNHDEFQFGKKAAYSFLSYKIRSRKEVGDKLKKLKISDDNVNKILEYLEKQNFINDDNYSRVFVESRLKLNPESKRNLRIKLLKKGIDRQTTDKVLDELIKENTEQETAEEILKKYKKKIRESDIIKTKRKCFNYLASKGFEFDLINEVLNSVFKDDIQNFSVIKNGNINSRSH